MKIESLPPSAQTRSQAGGAFSGDTGFQLALEQAATRAGQTEDTNGASSNQTKAAQPTLKEQYAEALSFFHDYLSKSPAQHLREAIMKEMGITEEELAALPPAEHAAKEGEIERRMRERMLGTKEGEMSQDSQQAATAAASLDGDSTYSPDKPLANQTVIANINAAAKGLPTS